MKIPIRMEALRKIVTELSGYEQSQQSSPFGTKNGLVRGSELLYLFQTNPKAPSTAKTGSK
jgi:hypothetical protein